MTPTLLLLLLLAPLAASCKSLPADTLQVEVGGTQRSYLEHIPEGLLEGTPAPLLLVFHGGAGTAAKAQAGFGFDEVSDKSGVLIAYPHALDGHWNDGRGGEKFAQHDAEVDDVAYALAVIDDMRARHDVDAARIYAVGASNGGMFVQRLAIEQAPLFAGVASLIASIPEPLAAEFAPAAPVSVLFMNGTEDPIVPYTGGEIIIDLFPRLGRRPRTSGRGRVLGAQAAAALWVAHNGLEPEARITLLPDTDKHDGTTARLHSWRGSESGCEVALLEIQGGGHTLPGGKQYLREKVIGRTSGDFVAAHAVWKFLSPKRR